MRQIFSAAISLASVYTLGICSLSLPQKCYQPAGASHPINRFTSPIVAICFFSSGALPLAGFNSRSRIVGARNNHCLIAWLENQGPNRDIERPLRTRRTRPLKAAAVGNGASAGGRADFYAGQNMICRILHAEPHGYAVLLPKYNFVGVLVTEQPLEPGEEVSAQYVCRSNGKMLLQCRFGPKATLPNET